MTPAGIPWETDLLNRKRTEGYASCSVRKDGGDDPDVTTGLLITARVERPPGEVTEEYGTKTEADDQVTGLDAKEKVADSRPRVIILGGEGVGRVTEPGLDQPVGEAAINHVPREMITREVTEVMELLDEPGPLVVTISVPGGEECAKKTFNPRLGILGGISIIGTSGIVEPMSEKALTDTIRLELRQRYLQGQRIAVVTPGNYGMDMLRKTYAYDLDRAVKCSNFIGDTIDMAAEEGFGRMVLLGHMGKLVKCAGGAMNTHSRYGDRRMELLADAAERIWAKKTSEAWIEETRPMAAGTAEDKRTEGEDSGDLSSLKCMTERIRACVSTEAALGLLLDTEAREVSRVILEEALEHLRRRADGGIGIEMILYTNVQGILAESPLALQWLEESKKSPA